MDMNKQETQVVEELHGEEELPVYDDVNVPLLVEEKTEGQVQSVAPVAPPPPIYHRVDQNDQNKQPKNDYTTGLFECGERPSTLAISCFLPCATFGIVGANLSVQEPDEEENPEEYPKANWKQKTVNSLPYVLVSGWGGSLFLPVMTLWQRYEVRKKYNLDKNYGTMVNDCLSHFICQPCAMAQDHREVLIRQKKLQADYAAKQQQLSNELI